jgi:hypothetical protein
MRTNITKPFIRCIQYIQCQSYVNVIDKGVFSTLNKEISKEKSSLILEKCSSFWKSFRKRKIQTNNTRKSPIFLDKSLFRKHGETSRPKSPVFHDKSRFTKHGETSRTKSPIFHYKSPLSKHGEKNLRYSSTNLYLENLRKFRGNFLL